LSASQRLTYSITANTVCQAFFSKISNFFLTFLKNRLTAPCFLWYT